MKMETSKNKTFILLVIALSLLAVAIMFSLGVLDFGKYLTGEPAEITDEPSTIVDEPPTSEVSFEPSSFDCPQFESLTASEQEELRNGIREFILESVENNTQPDNEIFIAKFPKCFTGPDSQN